MKRGCYRFCALWRGAPSTPSDAIEVAAKALNGALQDEVLELIRGMDPFAFERLGVLPCSNLSAV